MTDDANTHAIVALESARSLIGIPYCLGQMDCVQFIKIVYPMAPDEWEGLNLTNYQSFHDAPQAMEFFLDYIRSWTTAKQVPLPGDIVFFHVSGRAYFGIYALNHLAVSIFRDKGVIAVPIKGLFETRGVG